MKKKIEDSSEKKKLKVQVSIFGGLKCDSRIFFREYFIHFSSSLWSHYSLKKNRNRDNERKREYGHRGLQVICE